jgi:uncharacterized protein YbjT (DUF2867 family)
MILITGVTGHIGSELIPILLESGKPLRVLVRNERKVAYLDPSIERVVGDLNDPKTLDTAVRGVDRIFLVTLGTRQDIHILEAARRAGVRQIVKLSTLEASQPVIQVGKWHAEREELIRASGMDWTFLRPGMFMTNTIEWWSDSIKTQGAVYFPGGKGRVAPVDPRDVAAVAALALTRPGHQGQAYELTGPKLLTIGEMVQIIGRVLGKPLRYTDIPPIAARMWMLKNGMDKTLVNALTEMLRILRKDQGAICTGTFKELTGCEPRSFETWCCEHIAAFQV